MVSKKARSSASGPVTAGACASPQEATVVSAVAAISAERVNFTGFILFPFKCH